MIFSIAAQVGLAKPIMVTSFRALKNRPERRLMFINHIFKFTYSSTDSNTF